MLLFLKRLSALSITGSLLTTCVSVGSAPLGLSMITLSDEERVKVAALTHSKSIAITKPGEIFINLNTRRKEIEDKRAGGLCTMPGFYIDYSSVVEYRKLFKNPNDLRKTPFAEILIHKLIVASSDYYGSGDAAAANFAIRLLTGYAKRDYPALWQERRYGHTVGSGAQFLFAATVAHSLLKSYDGYSKEDRGLVYDWLKRKTLGPHVKFKPRGKYFGSDGVTGPIQSEEISGYTVNCCIPMGYESARLQVDNALMAGSILFNDQEGFESAIKGYIDVIGTLRSDGSLPYQTARGNAAIWYHNLGVSVLVMTAEMAANQGIDLYSYEAPSGATLHTAIEFLARSMKKPELLLPYAARNINPWRAGNGITDPNDYTFQLGVTKIPRLQRNRASFLAWFEPYERRFPYHPNIKGMSEAVTQVRSASRRPWKSIELPWRPKTANSAGGLFNDYTGSMTTCLFKDVSTL